MNTPAPSNPRKTTTPAMAPGISLTRDDIYFILFRHKWLIAGFSLLGIVASILFWFLQPPVYLSEAKLLVRYVFDAKASEGVGTDSQIKSPGASGENIINSEIEILTSLDLCEQVATTIGPDKILRRSASTNESLAAGGVIRGGLIVDVPRNSNVIKVGLQHREPEVAARALGQLIEAYLRRHVEVHRAIGVFDTVLSQQSDQFRTRLADTERQLRQYKTNFVGVSIEDARKALTEQVSKIRQDIFAAEAQLAESSATTGRNFAPAPITNSTNAAALTNTAMATNTASLTNIDSGDESLSPSTVNEYRSLCLRLDSLRNHELDLMAHYKDENSLVKNVRQQILETEVRKGLIENEHPSLLRIDTSAKTPGASPVLSFDAERLRILGLYARYIVLTNQLAQVKTEIAVLDNIDGDIQRLQRTRDLEEKNYRYYAAGIEQARFDEVLAGGKLSNISMIQAPTPPFVDNTKRLKIALGLLVGGILGGLAFAFLFELVLDRTLKRPGDVEDRLHLPLFVSIPRLVFGNMAALPEHAGSAPSPSDAVARGSSRADAPPPPGVWSVGHPLRSFFETLRDRVLFHFEGITRKPKLLGVTGCAHGSGVTTIAVGLAAALSETGGGSVLLVDLNLDHDAVHPFFHGRPGCGLADAIENDRREVGLVSENLYLALARNGGENGGESLPQRLSQLVPRLRVSDYDYIVFDMPRVTQTGITARLAGMMDLVLLVAESGKDQRDVLERALALLIASGAKVGGVLNKAQSYVPRRLRSNFYESTVER